VVHFFPPDGTLLLRRSYELANRFNYARNRLTEFYYSIAIDHSVLVEKVTKSKIPDGNIWLVFHKKQGVLDVVKKSMDSEHGKAYIKLDSYIFKSKEDSDDMVILEADHINSGPNEYNRKDESDFDNNLKGEKDEI
jgi:hypothetical protein